MPSGRTIFEYSNPVVPETKTNSPEITARE
jgi:hypothetical protein